MAKPENRAGYTASSELTLSLMTLRHTSLAGRVTAAAAAGFSGVGWRLEDFNPGPAGEPEIAAGLKTAGIAACELEYPRNWIGLEHDPGYCLQEQRLLELAGRLGTKWINVAVFEAAAPATIVASLAQLCRRAATYRITLQLEFMPYTPPVTTLHEAWKIVQATGQPNAGLLIDAWHWARAGESARSLELIPPERITGIQLSDGLPEALPDRVAESRHHRLIPGAGAFDLAAFLHLMNNHGVTAPLAVEVMSDELDALPPATAAGALADGVRSVLPA